jgi:hypothetical protein
MPPLTKRRWSSHRQGVRRATISVDLAGRGTKVGSRARRAAKQGKVTTETTESTE